MNSSTHSPPFLSVPTTYTPKTLSTAKSIPKTSSSSTVKSSSVTGSSTFRKTSSTPNLKSRTEPNLMIMLPSDKSLPNSLPSGNLVTPSNPKISTPQSSPLLMSTAKASSLPYLSSSKEIPNSSKMSFPSFSPKTLLFSTILNSMPFTLKSSPKKPVKSSSLNLLKKSSTSCQPPKNLKAS